ncbi:MAG: SAM-dependent methyltransferase [Bacteroidetes bacterium]|jgi:16S rRNA (cytidine1402-2'-O)-methyltransferase|nr:SAM-dependent methyltransferase [Bacteroidota bacterium]MBP9879908.1 SAM-dependent methyltransferase [Chitinophagales bacterium]
MHGTLYLVPTILSEEALHVIPQNVFDITNKLTVFFVENEKTARRYLRKSGFTASFETTPILPLNEHTDMATVSTYVEYLKQGTDCALMSEAGVPAVADPGSVLVRFCHQNNIRVVPLVGPSSILLALMGSGLNGQQFHFHGYIPVKQPQRKQYIQHMEAETKKGVTQIFIETPYRNNAILQDIISACNSDVLLCIAYDLTGTKESIRTQPISYWKKHLPALEKIPAIFLLGM